MNGLILCAFCSIKILAFFRPRVFIEIKPGSHCLPPTTHLSWPPTVLA
jgi:hypothetical protein